MPLGRHQGGLSSSGRYVISVPRVSIYLSLSLSLSLVRWFVRSPSPSSASWSVRVIIEMSFCLCFDNPITRALARLKSCSGNVFPGDLGKLSLQAAVPRLRPLPDHEFPFVETEAWKRAMISSMIRNWFFHPVWHDGIITRILLFLEIVIFNFDTKFGNPFDRIITRIFRNCDF